MAASWGTVRRNGLGMYSWRASFGRMWHQYPIPSLERRKDSLFPLVDGLSDRAMALSAGHINLIVCHSGLMDQDRRVEARVAEVGCRLGVAGESKEKKGKP